MGRGDLGTLVRICDPAGRPRGTGFVADDRGTVVTSHEAVEGLVRIVLRAPGDRGCVVGADAVTVLPGHGLALVRTEGLGVRPLPVAARTGVEPGTYVRIAAHGWREARVLGAAPVTYTFDGHRVPGHAWELAIGTEGAEALRLGGQATGGPVVDPETGAVLAVLGTALHGDHRAAGYALPLVPGGCGPAGLGPEGLVAGGLAPSGLAPEGSGPAGVAPGGLGPGGLAPSGPAPAGAAPSGPAPSGAVPVGGALGELLRRNAATAPCYGRELNLAAVLELTATANSSGAVGTASTWPQPVERADCAREFAAFAASDALVLALVGAPGSGRTTAIAAHCAQRARGTEPAPTVWLRGADLRADDTSVAAAVGRVLRQAGRIVTASGARGDTTTATPERAAALAREAGRPLLIVLDGPEEMPPALAHRLPTWTAGTESWLRAHGTRLMLGCRPEHWEQACLLYAPESLYGRAAAEERPGEPGAPWGPVRADRHPASRTSGAALAAAAGPTCLVTPGAVLLGDLAEDEAALARARYGLDVTDLAADDVRHPLTLRLLAEVREAVPGGAPGRPGREEVFGAHLDLMCLRIAVRIAAGTRPLPRGTAVRRLAARVAGQVHEAARRCLGPGQGELDRASFEEIFPWRTGWASAVLTEGLVVPAGSGYRFGHEEVADWIQGAHLDVDGALQALVHRRDTDAPVRLPARPGSPHVPPAPHPLPVPRHRIGPVVQALLLMDREHGSDALGLRLSGLAEALDRHRADGPADTDAAWWASRLLAQTLLRLPDPRPHLPVLRHLADRLGTRPTPTDRDTTPGGPPAAPRHEPAAPAVSGAGSASRPAPGPSPGDGDGRRSGPGPGPFPGDGSRAEPGPAPAPFPGDRDGRRSGPAPAPLPGDRIPTPRHAPDAPPGGVAPGCVPAQRVPAPAPWAPVVPAPALGPEPAAPEPTPHAPASAPVPVPEIFGPAFWGALRIGEDERIDLLRRLVPADPPPGSTGAPRFLDVVAERLVAEPRGVQPLLCRWFGDGRALAAAPYATVGTAAQALLHTHRHLAVDDLCEALVATAHPLAEGLLLALTEDEPSAVCRAVDRWAHDDGRPARRAAAATYGGLVAAHVTAGPDRELLRYAALALLARPGDAPLHGPALGLLLHDPHTRSRFLPRALTDPRVPASALATALPTDPEPVLAAFQARLNGPGEAAAETLRALAEVTTPALARRAAALVRAYAERHPEGAGHAAAFVDRRLEHGPAARAVLFPLVTGLLRGRSDQVRSALAPVLAAPGTGASRLLRTELLDVLLDVLRDHERYEARDPAILDALLRAAALGCERRPEVRTRDLVHRTGLLLVRTPEGATRFDRRLVELAREVPAFAAQLARWPAEAPADWAAVIGPSTRRTVQGIAGSMPMRDDGRGHGSLRPA